MGALDDMVNALRGVAMNPAFDPIYAPQKVPQKDLSTAQEAFGPVTPDTIKHVTQPLIPRAGETGYVGTHSPMFGESAEKDMAILKQQHDYSDPLSMAMAIMGGPRQLKLGAGRAGSYNISHPILNDDKPIGYLNLRKPTNPKALYVDMIQGFPEKIPQEGTGLPAKYNANAIGPAGIRALIPQLKEMYPEAEKIGGFRVSGARDKANKVGDAWMRLRFPSDPTELIKDAEGAALRRWRHETKDFRHKADETQGLTQRQMQESVRDSDLTRNLENPAVTEMTARRNAMKRGYPNWSEASTEGWSVDDKAAFRQRARYYGATTDPLNPITQEMSNAVRNRWLGAQQRAWRRDLDAKTQAQITQDALAMEQALQKR